MQKPIRRVTDRDRVDAIAQYTAERLGPQLLRDARLADIVPNAESKGATLGEIARHGDAWLEPLKCSWALERGANRLGLDARRTTALVRDATILRRRRNAHHHDRLTPMEEARSVREIANACKAILGLYGLADAQATIDHLALPPSIVYVDELRKFLSAMAISGELVTYEQARDVLGLGNDEAAYRILFRQLNVLAAMQMILGEPPLCSLVVDPDSKIPGKGFYWVVDLDRDAPVALKEDAHRRAVATCREYPWSENQQ